MWRWPLTFYPDKPMNICSLKVSQAVTTILEDRAGNLWLGAWYGDQETTFHSQRNLDPGFLTLIFRGVCCILPQARSPSVASAVIGQGK